MDAAQGKLEANQVKEKQKMPQERAINCPKCKSPNTKFCYYNNYRLAQPRYFCKGCRKYWIEGSSLKSVTVGDGSRKNKGSMSSSPIPKPIDLSACSSQNLTKQKGEDLNLGLKTTQQEYDHGFSEFLKLSKIGNNNTNQLNLLSSSSATTSTLSSVSAQDLLGTGTSFSDLSYFMLNLNPLFNIPGFNVQELKPPTMMFPFEVINQQLSLTRANGQMFVPGPSENLGDNDDDDCSNNGVGDDGDYNHE